MIITDVTFNQTSIAVLRKKLFPLPVLLLLLILPLSIFSQPIQIDRVEPGNWWVGFENPEVQLLIYGDDIRSARASVDYPGVTIEKTTLVENPNNQLDA